MFYHSAVHRFGSCGYGSRDTQKVELLCFHLPKEVLSSDCSYFLKKCLSETEESGEIAPFSQANGKFAPLHFIYQQKSKMAAISLNSSSSLQPPCLVAFCPWRAHDPLKSLFLKKVQ